MKRYLLLILVFLLGCQEASTSVADESCQERVSNALIEVLDANESAQTLRLRETRNNLAALLRNCPNIKVIERPMFGPFSRLHAAIISYDVELVEQVLRDSKGYVASEVDRPKRSTGAMHYAAAYGNERIIERLAGAGVSPDDVDEIGMTPLMWTIGESGVLSDNLRALIRIGAEVLIRDDSGLSVFDHVILATPLDLESLQVLVDSIDQTNEDTAAILGHAHRLAEENRLGEAAKIIDAER